MYFMRISGSLYFTMFVPGACRGQKRVYNPLELELPEVPINHVSAEN